MWHIAEKQWSDLGNVNTTGNLTDGTITSAPFIPNNYEVITFGTLFESNKEIIVNNLLTPNGDGINDYFVIENIELPNELRIYNRWGSLVHKVRNYQNDWDGKATSGMIYSKGETLPTGTYFYVLKISENHKIHTDWLYINY